MYCLTNRLGLTLLGVLVAGFAQATVQAAPTITDISPRGLQVGGTTTLTITGTGLTPGPRVLAKLPIAKQAVKPGAQSGRVQIEVTLDAKVPPGIYQLRVSNGEGVSGPVAVGVDQLPQRPFSAEIKSLPIALHGELTGGTILETRFTAKAGQRVVVGVEARRLGSALNPMVELYRPSGGLLKSCGALSRLVGDARFEVAKLPEDGTYTVKLHDALYRGVAPGFFRLKIGDLHYADMMRGPDVRGVPSTLWMASGSLATDEPLGGLPVHRTNSPFNVMPARWPRQSHITGGRPRVKVTNLNVSIYRSSQPGVKPGSRAEPVPFPTCVIGDFPSQNPWSVVFTVKPGMKIRCNVQSARLGAPTDVAIALSRAKGGVLATADDFGESTDPRLDFTVPEGVSQLVLTVEDRLRRNPRNRLEPPRLCFVDITEIQPDFSLVPLADRIEVPQGGTAVFRVRARRAGHNGPIKLRFHDGLPSGVSIVSGDVIPAGATDTLLTLRADDKAAGGLITQMLGEATIAGKTVRRGASLRQTVVTEHQPWLAREIAAVVTRRSPIQVAWSEESAKTPFVVGATYQPAVKVTRAAKAKGPVRLSLLTSQLRPVIRQKNNQVKPDTAKTLRLQAGPTIAADKDIGTLAVIVPPTLPTIEYDLAVRAELLSPDGKRVVATAVSPARRVRAVKPSFTLILSSPAQLAARAGKGPTGKLVGRIRRVGFPHPITLTLSGLPKGLPAPKLLIPGDQREFEFPIAFPKTTKPGELKGVKLIATSQLGPKNVVRATNEIGLQLKVVPEE